MFVPFSDYKQLYKGEAALNTRKLNEQQGIEKGKEYFQKYQKLTKNPWFFKKNLSRAEAVMINRARAGHYNLVASLFHIKVINDPSCECKYEQQDLTFCLPGFEPSNRPLKVAKLVPRIMYQLYTKFMSEGASIYRLSGSLKVKSYPLALPNICSSKTDSRSSKQDGGRF